MNLCRVLGTVVATEKHPAFAARKLMIVQPLDEQQKPLGKSFIAIDHSSSAGKGDVVLVMREGNGVRQIIGDKMAPIRSIIVGVVDAVTIEKA
jgi:ethanolamine utilization protein EutN